MRCLVTGAYGFIGSGVVAALRRHGVSVVGAGRDLDLAHRIHPEIEWIACDFNTDVAVAQWLPRLRGIDAVVNCVGILQDSLRDDADRIHPAATIALFQACAAAGVKRLVHVSAVSAEANVESSYARSKAKADAALETLDLSWLIVKPSLVVGQGSYGGTSLMRGLAGLPFVLFLPGPARERFQPIALDDLAAGIAKLALTEAPSRTTLYAAGPETVSLREILLAYRAWLGFGPAREIVVPLPLLRGLLKLGDAGLARSCLLGAHHLAGAAPLRHAGRRRSLRGGEWGRSQRLQRDAQRHARHVAGPAACAQHLRRSPAARRPGRILDSDWHPDAHAGKFRIRHRAGCASGVGRWLRQSSGGRGVDHGHSARTLFLLPGWVRRAGTAQLVLSAIYLIGLSLLAPSLWTDHFGPLLKVVPMMAATLMVMAFEEKR